MSIVQELKHSEFSPASSKHQGSLSPRPHPSRVTVPFPQPGKVEVSKYFRGSVLPELLGKEIGRGHPLRWLIKKEDKKPLYPPGIGGMSSSYMLVNHSVGVARHPTGH